MGTLTLPSVRHDDPSRVGDYRIVYTIQDDRLIVLDVSSGPPPRGLRPLNHQVSPTTNLIRR